MTSDHFSSVAEALAAQASSVAEHLWPQGKRTGDNWCVGDVYGTAPSGEGSFRVRLSGPKAGLCKDFASDQKGFDLLDAWAHRFGITKQKAAQEAACFLGLGSQGSRVKDRAIIRGKAPRPTKALNKEYNERLRTRLKESPQSIAYLHNRGLTDDTIDQFLLGLSMPYTDKDGNVRENALAYPLRLAHGGYTSKYGYYRIPEVTANPVAANGWMAGQPQCYYASPRSSQRALFVVEGIKDVWRHWQALASAGLTDEILVISSTHGGGIPAEWKNPSFWQHWEIIYVAHDRDDAGDRISERVQQLAEREVRRVRVPAHCGKDWTDYWQAGGTIEEFRKLLDEAETISSPILDRDGGPEQTGRMSLETVDIDGAYSGGHLYYTTEVLVRDWMTDERGEDVIGEYAETIVVRSDRSDWRVIDAYAPKLLDTARCRRKLIKLSDGTILAREPQPSPYHTWKWPSIMAYLDNKEKVRPLPKIVDEIHSILRRSVWLPYEEDYALLALMIPATYVQRVFESVPLFLLNGPAGSGKTQLASIVAKMAYNGNVIGQVSAASIARHIDRCRGFTVIDDLEAIGDKSGKEASQFNELVQALKVSYNQASAQKIWTDVKTMRTEKLDFFGIKMINNTLGTDRILGTRMLKIQTRSAPKTYLAELSEFKAKDELTMDDIRQELHTWAFKSVQDVHQAYHSKYNRHVDRSEEIAAPLRVIADLVDNETLTGLLEKSLSRQAVQVDDPDDPTEVLHEAVRSLVREGFETVTLMHVSLQMRNLLDVNFGRGTTNEIPEYSRTDVIGRRLRSEDLVEPVNIGRKRFFGKNLRMIRLSEWVIREVREELEKAGGELEASSRPVDDFCRGCEGCPYRNAGCELMEARAQAEKRTKSTH